VIYVEIEFNAYLLITDFMKEYGLLVGCDKYEEWLLDWWWTHYTKTNSYPVAFADFGLTENGKKWCQAHGECVTCPELFSKSDQNRIPEKTRELWEKVYGKGIWDFRPVWFKKPYACIRSPFEKTIWVDLDCQINADLTPLFTLLDLGAEISILKNGPIHQKIRHDLNLILPKEDHYNSGVIAFHKKSPTICKWADLSTESSDMFSGDEEALSRAIYLENPNIIDLPDIYNWSWEFPQNDNAHIIHFHGHGKYKILDRLKY
jgi:hypothetical protein